MSAKDPASSTIKYISANVLVCSSGTGIRDPSFRGQKCLRTRTGLLGLVFVSSSLMPKGKFTGSGFSGSRPSIADYTNGGISGGEGEEKDERSGVKRGGGGGCTLSR